jgi:hypothetical protein
VVKVREGLARDDYKDPGPYKHPPGTVAYEFKGDVPDATRRSSLPTQPNNVELSVVKPGAKSHSNH